MQVCESHTYCNRYRIWSDERETACTPVLTSPSCDILIPILSFKAICQDFLSQVSLYAQLASFSVLVSAGCVQIDGTQSRPLSALELFLVCADIWSALRMSCNKVLLSSLFRHKASTCSQGFAISAGLLHQDLKHFSPRYLYCIRSSATSGHFVRDAQASARLIEY